MYARVFKKRSKPNSDEPLYENMSHAGLVIGEEPLYFDASLAIAGSGPPQSSPIADELVYCELNFCTSTGAKNEPTTQDTLYASIANS